MHYKLILLWLLAWCLPSLNAQPIAVHPENPHYFIYKGKPIILISSSEHYGAILNKAFDYKTYLETLAKDNLNYARIFTGTYVEKPGDFGIEQNTLAPDSMQLIVPWKRSDVPGYFYGGNKFDLEQWDEAYFERLKDLLTVAAKNNIIIEITLFSSQYRGWPFNPLHPTNNINGTDAIERNYTHTIFNGNLFHYQEAFTRKMVQEVNHFDNFFFEIQNEPYADSKVKVMPVNTYQHNWQDRALDRIDLATPESLAWQKKIADIIVDEESKLPKKHLIAQNYANFFYSLPKVEDNIDILNFHYSYPEANRLNYGYNLPIGFDEAGFAITDSSAYRRQAWNFILSGGALYNNLDYSFAVGYEDGTCDNNAPGFGGKEFRKHLSVLKKFVESFDFLKMKPDYESVVLAPGAMWQVLSEKGKQYAIYLEGGNQTEITLQIPAGKYNVKWINTETGEIDKSKKITIDADTIKLMSPEYEVDIALGITKI
ncbi:MAG: hypothetical protein ACOCW8_01690 [bacterium]